MTILPLFFEHDSPEKERQPISLQILSGLSGYLDHIRTGDQIQPADQGTVMEDESVNEKKIERQRDEVRHVQDIAYDIRSFSQHIVMSPTTTRAGSSGCGLRQ